MRALDSIFLLASADPDTHTVVKMSMLEVYNERIADLLNASSLSVVVSGGGGGGGGASGGGLEVRVGKAGAFVEGLSEWVVRSTEEVKALMAQGQQNRRVASNNVNEHSSRSHGVILVKVRGLRVG